VKRWGGLAVAGIVLAAGIVGWRAWPRDDVCDAPKVVSTPSALLPAATPAAALAPPKPAPDEDSALLHSAARYPGSRQLGKLRWAMRATHVPANRRLGVRANHSVVVANVRPELAGYRLSDGKLLWRLADKRISGEPDLRGDTLVLSLSEIVEKKRGSEATAAPEPRSAVAGLDAQTGKVRWCLRDRYFCAPTPTNPKHPPAVIGWYSRRPSLVWPR
jgi:hypothetical protein